MYYILPRKVVVPSVDSDIPSLDNPKSVSLANPYASITMFSGLRSL